MPGEEVKWWTGNEFHVADVVLNPQFVALVQWPRLNTPHFRKTPAIKSESESALLTDSSVLKVSSVDRKHLHLLDNTLAAFGGKLLQVNQTNKLRMKCVAFLYLCLYLWHKSKSFISCVCFKCCLFVVFMPLCQCVWRHYVFPSVPFLWTWYIAQILTDILQIWQ